MRACVLNGTKMACYDTIKGHVVEATGWTRKGGLGSVPFTSHFRASVKHAHDSPLSISKPAVHPPTYSLTHPPHPRRPLPQTHAASSPPQLVPAFL